MANIEKLSGINKLAKIQQELKVPKNQYNSFADFKYRSNEDILEAVKPLLNGALLTLSDKMVEVGGRIYVEATAEFTDGEYTKTVTASARETESKKKMDDSQITGSASSYARKYALNGMFLIDDTRDADTMDNSDAPNKVLDQKAIDQFTITVNEFTDKKELAEKSTQLIKESKINTALAKKIIRNKYEALK